MINNFTNLSNANIASTYPYAAVYSDNKEIVLFKYKESAKIRHYDGFFLENVYVPSVNPLVIKGTRLHYDLLYDDSERVDRFHPSEHLETKSLKMFGLTILKPKSYVKSGWRKLNKTNEEKIYIYTTFAVYDGENTVTIKY